MKDTKKGWTSYIVKTMGFYKDSSNIYDEIKNTYYLRIYVLYIFYLIRVNFSKVFFKSIFRKPFKLSKHP